MLIRVRHSTGKIEQVPPRKLQKLIDKRKIIQFMRSSGWVTVGFDQIRNADPEDYAGPERRC
jgi:hypothetical protein